MISKLKKWGKNMMNQNHSSSAFEGGRISETSLKHVCCVIQVNYTPFSKGAVKNQSWEPSLVNLHKPEKAAFWIRGWMSPTKTSSSNIAMWDQICAGYQMISATIERFSNQWNNLSNPSVMCNYYIWLYYTSSLLFEERNWTLVFQHFLQQFGTTSYPYKSMKTSAKA